MILTVNFPWALVLTELTISEKDLYRSTIIGGSILGFYNVIPQLQISAEFEELHVTRNYDMSSRFKMIIIGIRHYFLGRIQAKQFYGRTAL